MSLPTLIQIGASRVALRADPDLRDATALGWPDWPYSDLEHIASVRVGAVSRATVRRLAELAADLEAGVEPWIVEKELRHLLWSESAALGTTIGKAAS